MTDIPNWEMAFGLEPADGFMHVDDAVLTLPGVPQGIGPIIGRVLMDASAPAGGVSSAHMEWGTNQVFRLLLAQSGTSNDPSVAIPTQLPVAPLEELGSATLQSALAAHSLPDILEALAYDVVIVPVVVGSTGDASTRLFEVTDRASKPALCLFSSAQTLSLFLGDSQLRSFVVAQGAAVIEYLAGVLPEIDHVVFDAAGPTALSIGAPIIPRLVELDSIPADLLGQAFDEAQADEQPLNIVGFSVNLDSLWGKVDLHDKATRDAQIAKLISRQTRNLGAKAAGLRNDMHTWLTDTADQAVAHGGSQLAFQLARTGQAAAALSVVVYYHDMGVQDGHRLVDVIAQHLAGLEGSDAEVVKIDLGGQIIVRHRRRGHGNKELGGQDVALLLIDYWVAAPDNQHAAHVSFSSPHVNATEAITVLADNVVANSNWEHSDQGAVDFPEPSGVVI